MSYSSIQLAQAETALSRLIEATKRKKTAKIIQAPVDALDTKLGALFVRQGNDLVRALSPLKVLIKEASITKQFDKIFDVATANTSVDMLAALETAYKAALTLGAINQLTEIGVKISFKLDNPRAKAYIAQYGAEQIAGIDEQSKQDIRNLLLAGIENGDSYNAIAQAIKARYKHYATGVPQQHIRSRAHLIAITEYGQGYQAGNYASMQVASDTGLKLLKQWSTFGDNRVSDGCRKNGAQGFIPLNQLHNSGDKHPLRFPGCRCVELYKRDKG